MGEDTRGDEETEQEQDEVSISKHYGWLLTLYELSETSILSITGDKSILDLNIVFIFNFLSMKNEIDRKKAQEQKKQVEKIKMQSYGRRIR